MPAPEGTRGAHTLKQAGGSWKGHPALGEVSFCNHAWGSENLCECSITCRVIRALWGWWGRGKAGIHLPVGSMACVTWWRTFTIQPNNAAPGCWNGRTTAGSARLLSANDGGCGSGDRAQPSHVAGGFSPHSSSPCCTHPTHVTHHHTLLHIPLSPAGKEQNAGVIKDNELLISTGKHNWKHFISIAFRLINIKHKASQLHHHACSAQSTLTEQVCN